MSIQIQKRIFDRILFYLDVHEKSDSSKVANPAYDEMIVSIIELIYKFGGTEYFANRISDLQNDRFRIKLNMFLLIFDKDIAIRDLNNLVYSKNETVAMSARNIVDEKYDTIGNTIKSYKTILTKVAAKRKLDISTD